MTYPNSRLPEKRDKFHPEIHLDLMKRAVLMKIPVGQISELFGIQPETLARWLRKYPELAEAANFNKTADMDMVWSIYCKGMGIDPFTGDQLKEGSDMRAAIFWVKSRLQWTDQPSDKGAKGLKDMSIGEIMSLADELNNKLETNKIVAPGGRDEITALLEGSTPAPGSHFPGEKDADAGF